MERWFPDVSYCHFQSMAGECLPLGKAVNFKILSFVDLLPISRLLPLLPSTCLFWNSTFLLACFEGMFPWLSCSFFSYTQSFATVFFTPKRKKCTVLLPSFSGNCYRLLHTGLYSSYCWFSLYPPYFLMQDQEISSSRTIQRQKFAISVAPKGVNLCDRKVAENATTQILTKEQLLFYTATTDRVTPELWGMRESSKHFQSFP